MLRDVSAVPLRVLRMMELQRTAWARRSVLATHVLMELGWSPLDLHPDCHGRFLALMDGEMPWTERFSGYLFDQEQPEFEELDDMRDRVPSPCVLGWCDHDGHDGSLAVRRGRRTPDWYWSSDRFAEHVSVMAGSWKYERALHHRLIGERLAVAVQRGGRLRVSTPPQVGKSSTVSLYGPMWAFRLTHGAQCVSDPARVIVVSYESSLSTSWGREIRNMLDQAGPSLGLVLSDDSSAANRFSLRAGESFTAAGSQGAVTGRPATLLIVDDPHKGYADSHSEGQREAVWSTYATTARTRVHPGSAILAIGTRWHEDDLNGRLETRSQPGEWEVVVIPGIAEEDDLLGREPGEPLWPESGRDLDFWQSMKHDLGQYMNSALVQGRPAPPGGELFKRDRWEYVDAAPAGLQLVRHWDLAATEDGGDETVGALLGRDRNGFTYILDLACGRWGPAELERAIAAVADRDKAEHSGRVTQLIEQEPGSGGKSWANYLAREVLAGHPVELVAPSTAKVERMRPLAGQLALGNIKIVLSDGKLPEWAHELIEQSAAVPHGAHDDRVDSCSGAYNHLAEKKRVSKAKVSSVAGQSLSSRRAIEQRLRV